MTLQDEFKFDCRQFRAERPCAPHKLRGVTCPDCDEYDPVTTRVLMIKLDALGDVLRTTALLPAVKAAFPGSHITWVTAPDAVPLFDGNDLVDRALSTGDAATSARLATERFDVVLCPDADPAAAALAASAAGEERRGFTLDRQGRVVPLGEPAERWFRMGLNDELKKANEDTYQELVAGVLGLDSAALGEPFIAPSLADREAAKVWRDGLSYDGKLVGLNTGAGSRWRYKAWTRHHQQGFIEAMAAAGVGVVLLGGPGERDRHRELRDVAAGTPVFDGGNDNTVGRFAALVGVCDAVVTGDTFALHIAVASRVPVVALFGPTSSAEIELYGRGEKVMPKGLECLGCYLPSCEVTPHCQELIEPDLVAAAARRCLGE